MTCPWTMPLRKAVLLAALAVPPAADALAQRAGEPVSLFVGRVFDGRGEVIRNATVIVDGDRILRIEPRRTEAPTWAVPDGTLLPGLIDVHVHVSAYVNRQGRMHVPGDGDTPAQSALSGAANAWATLRAGFTTVQSLGAEGDRDLREWIAGGTLPGPRTLTSLAPITDPSLTPEELQAEVRRRIAAGADVIKLFASRSIRDGGTPTLTEAQLRAACAEAAAGGVRAIVHAHAAESIRAAVLAGCHQIEHGIFATPESLGLMAERGVYFSPQCALIFRNYLEHRAWFRGLGNFNDESFAAMERAMPIALSTLRAALSTPNLRVVYGTDAVAGAHGGNAEDLVCRVRQAGQRARDALVSATSLAAESLGLADQIGTIAAGYRADLIVVAGNPLDDISAIQRVLLVMKDGRVVRHDPTLAELRPFR